MNARWLVRLYPAPWRERYGDEFADLLAAQRVTPALVIDIIGGAVDARLRPQSVPGSATHKGEEPMTGNLLKRCAAGGAHLTPREQKIGVAIMLGVTLVLSGVYILAAARYRGNQMVDAFGIMLFPIAMALTLPFTYLKNQTWPARIVITLATLVLVALASYLASFA